MHRCNKQCRIAGDYDDGLPIQETKFMEYMNMMF